MFLVKALVIRKGFFFAVVAQILQEMTDLFSRILIHDFVFPGIDKEMDRFGLIIGIFLIGLGSTDAVDHRFQHIAKRHLNDGQFFSAARAFENNRWKGNAYYRAGDYLSAIIFYEKSSESNTPLVIYNLANCYAMLGDLDTAIMLYEKVTATDNPHNYDATYNLNLLKQLQFEELTKQHAISAENVNLISTADGGNNECSKEEGCKDLNPQDLIRNRLRNMQNRSSLKKGPLKQW